ncbi:hypothetical protein [Thermoanaerobacterium thermosaccharolyticum]|uniref:Uncharacterized protein n=1 Tax=Thermoanaerobacterium thermosaccharolyticum M0795 TaxID=698948 RepID=L0INB6_THETR|nr:hypothetical protein [Thermoanaerobacterium thermosaccharolyticum]AGB20259.1 hypothetical protein Thethe_02696 [Thermoanaerobacterium thermosaccharolyticum M0795]
MNRKSIRISICLILILILSLSLSGTSFASREENEGAGKQIAAPIVENLEPSSETTKMTSQKSVPLNVDIISNQVTVSNEEAAKPASETTKMTSQKVASLNADVNPMSLSRPTKGTNLPYSGAFSGVNTEIFSNYYFFTNGSTQLYVDWNVRADYPANVLWHINVYQAGTNKFVMSSDQFSTDSNTDWWTTRFYNLDPAYNYYISFVNDGPQIGSPISGDFTVRLK